jgi:5'-deoxynucleotidase YfbR-like HD superfamily hydrolase
MIERLSGDFNRGYTKALMDLTEVVKYIQDDLHDHHKRLTEKMFLELLSVCLENREKLRDNWGGFIRWNNKAGEFEYYQGE